MVIVMLLLFPILLLYLAVFIPIDIFRHWLNKRRFRRTRTIISNSGYIIGVGGKIGAGKSTSTAGITTYLENYVLSLIYEKMDYVQTIMNKYDFTELNNYLSRVFFDEKIDKLQNDTLPLTNNALYISDEYHRYYDDGIKTHTYEDMLKDYMEAYLALNRGNYVYSNIKFDSIVTGNRAFDLKGSDFKIKDRLLEKNYRLRRYSVFFYDEATLDVDKINFNWQNTARDDSGTIEHLRLFRHYFKGKSYYITTLQNPERLVKAERELFNSIYMIRDKCDFEEFKRIKSVINIIDACNEKIHKIKTKIKRLLHIPLKSDKRSMYKNVKRFLLQRMDKLNSKDFLVYTVDIYDTTKEAENNSKNRFTTKLVLPKKWCYGPIDTYEYSYQYDATVAVSEVSPEQKKQDEFIEEKIELANEMLKKKIVDKKKKNKDEEDKETSYKEEKIVIGGC